MPISQKNGIILKTKRNPKITCQILVKRFGGSVLGHEWKATIASRNSGRGCPYCSGNFVEEKDSLFYISKLINGWNYSRNSKLNPKKLSKSSNLKVWWKCSKGHEYQATIANRTKSSGCPYCSGRRVEKQNSFATKYPHLLKQWNDKKNNLDPFELSFQSHKKVWWICDKNHEWEATVKHRVNEYLMPILCRKKIIELNSLFSLKPKVYGKNGTTKKTLTIILIKLVLVPVLKYGGSVKKDILGKLKFITGLKMNRVVHIVIWRREKKSKLIEV